jgi:hypothetical protein
MSAIVEPVFSQGRRINKMRLYKAIFFGLGLMVAAGLVACSDNTTGTDDTDDTGGTPTPYVDEGSAGSPLDITGLLPYDGEVSKSGYSYYRVTGALPDSIYTTTLTLIDGLPYQIVPNAAATGGIACGWVNTTPGATIDCAMRATAGGVLDFSVQGDTTVGGAFTVTVSLGGIVNEGHPGTPVEVSAFPFSGSALIQSYYLLTGLTPGGAYACKFTDASSPVALFIFPDDTYQSQPTSCSSRNDSGEPCNVTADASGYIYLMTNAQENLYGVTYTISVTGASVANEGSRNSPIDITSLLTYSGMVHLGSSWYIISGLTAGSPCTITLSNASDAANLYLYGPGWDVGQRDCYHWWANGDGTSIECVSVADSNGDIRVEVQGIDSADGATFDLDMAAGGVPSEGYFGAPVDVTGVTPWSGSLYKDNSYYKITGLAAATDYTVTISDLTDNLSLYVCDDVTQNNQLCFSTQLGTVDETCVVQTATGELHIRVGWGNGSVRSVTFSLDVTP